MGWAESSLGEMPTIQMGFNLKALPPDQGATTWKPGHIAALFRKGRVLNAPGVLAGLSRPVGPVTSLEGLCPGLQFSPAPSLRRTGLPLGGKTVR